MSNFFTPKRLYLLGLTIVTVGAVSIAVERHHTLLLGQTPICANTETCTWQGYEHYPLYFGDSCSATESATPPDQGYFPGEDAMNNRGFFECCYKGELLEIETTVDAQCIEGECCDQEPCDLGTYVCEKECVIEDSNGVKVLDSYYDPEYVLDEQYYCGWITKRCYQAGNNMNWMPEDGPVNQRVDCDGEMTRCTNENGGECVPPGDYDNDGNTLYVCDPDGLHNGSIECYSKYTSDCYLSECTKRIPNDPWQYCDLTPIDHCRPNDDSTEYEVCYYSVDANDTCEDGTTGPVWSQSAQEYICKRSNDEVCQCESGVIGGCNNGSCDCGHADTCWTNTGRWIGSTFHCTEAGYSHDGFNGCFANEGTTCSFGDCSGTCNGEGVCSCGGGATTGGGGADDAGSGGVDAGDDCTLQPNPECTQGDGCDEETCLCYADYERDDERPGFCRLLCGNSVHDPGEECDTVQHCTATCVCEDGYTPDAEGANTCREEVADCGHSGSACGAGISRTCCPGLECDGLVCSEDECPDDPEKFYPGECGCGVRDIDTDNDGTPDCTDECPEHSVKSEEGICGCTAPDIDTNGDGQVTAEDCALVCEDTADCPSKLTECKKVESCTNNTCMYKSTCPAHANCLNGECIVRGVFDCEDKWCNECHKDQDQLGEHIDGGHGCAAGYHCALFNTLANGTQKFKCRRIVDSFVCPVCDANGENCIDQVHDPDGAVSKDYSCRTATDCKDLYIDGIYTPGYLPRDIHGNIDVTHKDYNFYVSIAGLNCNGGVCCGGSSDPNVAAAFPCFCTERDPSNPLPAPPKAPIDPLPPPTVGPLASGPGVSSVPLLPFSLASNFSVTSSVSSVSSIPSSVTNSLPIVGSSVVSISSLFSSSQLSISSQETSSSNEVSHSVLHSSSIESPDFSSNASSLHSENSSVYFSAFSLIFTSVPSYEVVAQEISPTLQVPLYPSAPQKNERDKNENNANIPDSQSTHNTNLPTDREDLPDEDTFETSSTSLVTATYSSTNRVDTYSSYDTIVAAAAVCGNGVLDAHEECDDSNARDNDGCSSTCLLEIGICGDGVIQSLLGEQCEAATHDFRLPYSCVQCRFLSTFCGDANLDPGEECDDGLQNSTSPDARCRPDCSSSRCGDGIVDSVETCDDGNRVSGDGCDRYCQIEHKAPLDPPTPEVPEPTPDPVVPPQVATQQQIIQQMLSDPTFAMRNPQLAAQFGFPQMPTYNQVPYQLPLAQLQPLVQSRGPVGDTGPAAAAVIGAGSAAGLSWIRRRRK